MLNLPRISRYEQSDFRYGSKPTGTSIACLYAGFRVSGLPPGVHFGLPFTALVSGLQDAPAIVRRGEAAIMSLMTLNPCINLSFDGQCEAAFKFYERCLNGKITFMLTWGNSPMAKEAPPEWSSKILHATLAVGNTRLQGSDPAPGSYESPRGFAIKLSPSEGDAERLFAELAKGGTVRMPLQETFWAHRFGVLTDRFGIPWVINCGKSE